MRYVPALSLIIIVLLADLLIEQDSVNHHRQVQQVEVLEQLSLLRAKLEGAINANFHLLNGMSAAIATDPQFDDNQFNLLAEKLLENRHQLRNIAAAPDLVIRHIYPLAGNEGALGLDYQRTPEQREAALRARDLNTMVIAGPVNLAQGGEGLIARLPVFRHGEDGHSSFWGLVSSVIDSQALWQAAGLNDQTLKVELAIRGKDSLGAQGAVFYGDPALFEQRPSILDIQLPHGSWQLAAIPKQGWYQQAPQRWLIRGLSVTLLVIALLALQIWTRRHQLRRQRRETLYAAFDHSPLGVLLSNDQGSVEYINKTFKNICLLEPDSISRPKLAQQLPAPLQEWISTPHNQETGDIQIPPRSETDSERRWRCFSSYLQTADGTKQMTLVQDITEHDQLIKQLELSKQVIDHTSDAVVITDASANIIEVNEAFCRITGYDRGQIMGQKPSVYKSDRHDTHFYSQIWEQLQRVGSWTGEIWNRKIDGELFPCWLSINRIGEPNSPERQYIGIFSDISNIKKAEKNLQQIAYYDPLTSLPNRSLFHDRLKQEISHCRRNQQQLALLFIDLDRFKYVNDSFGHSVGDELLKVIAERLVSEVRENDTVTRLGGDEFTVIISELLSIGSTTTLIKRMLQRIQEPIYLAGQELHVGASVGIAIYPNDGEDPETLLRHADMAMYQAKEQGRNGFHYFTEQLQQRASSRLQLESQLRQAIEEQQFEVYYQPKLELHSNRVLGMEALVRWHHPETGLVSPNDFIPIAEETGLIINIGNWVMEQACQQTRQWHLEGWSHLRVAVNLSARQFAREELAEDIRRILDQTQLPADALELEITESMVVDDGDLAVKTLTQLRRLGVEVSIDDFGTGYSNLQYLKQFPLNSLKIDRGFVRDLVDDREDKAIIKAIILMARGLGLNVIAEGIENEQQLAFLLEQHCPMGQGFLFSRPLPADQFIDWVQQHEQKIL